VAVRVAHFLVIKRTRPDVIEWMGMLGKKNCTNLTVKLVKMLLLIIMNVLLKQLLLVIQRKTIGNMVAAFMGQLTLRQLVTDV
tara:strand:- start:97 stop:345 length:249 start_codon:yes stop_codon:yes gene_type:complete